MNQSLSYQQNWSTLQKSFPTSVREDFIGIVAQLPTQYEWKTLYFFEVNLREEKLLIPQNFYFDEQLFDDKAFSKTQQTIIHCLFTRHHNGFIREKYLLKIIDSEDIWVMPFIVHLIGSYVVEIISLIYHLFDKIHSENLRNFILENPIFYHLTRQRLISYWNCYHRNLYQKQEKEDYVGFQLLTKIDDLIK